MTTGTNIQRAFVNMSLYSLMGLLQKASGILLLPIFTRYMAPDDYGVVATVTAVATVCAVLMGLGLRRAAGRFYFDAPEDAEFLARLWGTILVVSLVSVFVVGATLIAVSPWTLQPWLENISVYPYLLLAILIAAGQPFQSIYSEILRMQHKGRTYAKYQGVLFVTNILLGLLLVVGLELKAVGALLGYAGTAVLGAVIALGLMGRRIRWSIDREILPDLLSYSVPVLPHAIFATLIVTLDKVLLNGLDSAHAVGLYAVSVSVASVLKIVANSTNQAVQPVAFELFGDFGKSRRDYLASVSLAIVSVYALVAVWGSLLSQEIILLLASTQFAEAWLIVPVLLYGRFLHGIYYVYSLGIHYEKSAAKLLVVLSSAGLVVNLAGNLLLIPLAGAWGAAIAAMLASLSYVLIGRFLSAYVHEMRWPEGQFALIAAGTLLSCAAIYSIAQADVGWATSISLRATVGLIFSAAAGLFMWSQYRNIRGLETELGLE